MHVSSVVNPRALLFGAALIAAVASPMAAQQAAIRAPVADTASAPVNTPARPLPGPRVRADLRAVQPSFSESHAAPVRRTETITISVLVLVLAVVILVLLLK